MMNKMIAITAAALLGATAVASAADGANPIPAPGCSSVTTLSPIARAAVDTISK